MKHLLRGLSLLIVLLTAQNSVAQTLNSILKAAPNQEAFWSVSVRNQNGEVVESVNAGKVIVPASNQKLLTTSAVLDHFGSDFRYQTSIYGAGELNDGDSTWAGNLIIKGSGDPTISGVLYDGDRYYVFREFLKQLKSKGIQAISGDLIADVSYFDGDVYPAGWGWYDMSFYYSVQISPLSFNNNTVDLEVFADGEIGDAPRINWFPDSTNYVQFVNKQVITHPSLEYDEYYRRQMGGNRIVLASSLPQGYYETEALSVNDPARYFLHSFRHYLAAHGIVVQGKIRVADETISYDSTTVLATHQSKPMAEIVRRINKESDNFYAEMILKTLSADVSGRPGSFDNGVKLVRTFLAEMGVDTNYVQMNDGSGLADGNFNRTANFTQLLYTMESHPEYQAFRNSFPIAGVDGSLSYRMKDSPLKNKFLGKTGFVSGVRTISGYLATKSGKQFTVSIATNHFISDKLRPIDHVHEQILEYLYDKY
jgi:D-alanyl-D-alanine carboxypeptidase/D-alanyl-D-alanine-endopeptidase (penicillin-binding protein 4)